MSVTSMYGLLQGKDIFKTLTADLFQIGLCREPSTFFSNLFKISKLQTSSILF